MSVLKVKIAELRESRKLDNKTAMATALSGRHCRLQFHSSALFRLYRLSD